MTDLLKNSPYEQYVLNDKNVLINKKSLGDTLRYLNFIIELFEI